MDIVQADLGAEATAADLEAAAVDQGKCTTLHAATAVQLAKFHLPQRPEGQFGATTVSQTTRMTGQTAEDHPVDTAVQGKATTSQQIQATPQRIAILATTPTTQLKKQLSRISGTIVAI